VDISKIHFHDASLLRVVEDTAQDMVVFEVDYPTDWEANVYAMRWIAFDDVLDYRVCEGPFQGTPTILDVQTVGDADGRYRLRIDTNAGFRELSCRDVRLLELPPRRDNPAPRGS
jgi:hypothetical protein